ncbi:hypothetical protein ACO0LF_03580 [Undibacterium sp. Di27W]|uniref:hypothetical protein n=1 Tax=Undibacterium sp. Di27W TaxID=3413036 RepID=UPI003BF38F00
MIGIPKTDTLAQSVISGVCFEGLTITTKDGKPAQLAVIDADGNIVESGAAVAKEAWNVTLAVYKNFLVGQGHLRIFSQPPGLNLNQDQAIAA